ncbi:MAG: ABC transporter ATP-binding protein [Candidatus Kapabacteria bacterium]|jgi:heme exporter protein A|nr:ABC transporter ATP-binding protein [Candidatus Kapabacteria bacterium]
MTTSPMLSLTAENLTQRFNQRLVWRDISFQVQSGEIWGITGKNGSGKTTLLRALCGLLTPSGGKVSLHYDGKECETEEIVRYCGFVAPYLTLYEEFTPLELCSSLAAMRGTAFDLENTLLLMEHFSIESRRNDILRGFSSGMKQRIKYVLAFLFHPPLLVLDEPMTNLDEAGMSAVEMLIKRHHSQGGACIIATNDARDLALCTNQLAVTTFSA